MTFDPHKWLAQTFAVGGLLVRDPALLRQAFALNADYLLDLLQHHRERLTPWRPDDEKTRTLRYLVEQRRRLVNDGTRTTNRLTALLKSYFPQVLNWFSELRTLIVCDFLDRWPTLEAVQRTRPTTVNKFLRSHHSVRRETNERRLAEIKTAVPLTTDLAVLNSSKLIVKGLTAQLRTTIKALAELDRHIEALCQTHQDYELFSSLPGVGSIYAARLTAAMGSDRSRWTRVEDLLCFSGVAPVIERSGKQNWIRWRYFCPKFFRQSFVEYAEQSIQHSFWARAYYSMQRAKGKGHYAAVRALAFKWIRIIWKCWQTRTPYNEVIYLESLRKSGSPLLKFAAEHQA